MFMKLLNLIKCIGILYLKIFFFFFEKFLGLYLIKMSVFFNELEEVVVVLDFSIKCGYCLRFLEKEKDKGILC